MLKRGVDEVEFSAVAKRMVVAYFPIDLSDKDIIKIGVAWYRRIFSV